MFVYFRMITLSAMVVLGGWLAMQFVGGFGTIGSEGGGVAYWAHIGGFVAGIAAIAMLWTIRGRPNNWPEMPHAPAPPMGPWGLGNTGQ